MKSAIIATIFALVAIPALGMPVYEDPEKEKPKAQCPKTLITGEVSDCLQCHVVPDFSLKEKKPDANREYPNYRMRVYKDRDGVEKGYLHISDIESSYVKEFFDYLRHHGINHAIFEIHSPGGSLFEAWRIVGLMRHHQEEGIIIETRCHGFAASAGFLIFVSGTKGFRLVSEQAELMWHELITFQMFAVSSPADKEDAAKVLRHLQDTANEWIAGRSNLSIEELNTSVRKKEFWCRGSEAVDKYGLADGFLN